MRLATDPGEHAVTRDGALVRRAQAGDTAAFGQIVTQYERRVLALARRTVGTGSADPEDIAQEVFLKAWRAIGRFDPDRPLDPWVMTIAVRVARTHGARERRRRMFRLNRHGDEQPQQNADTPATDDLWSRIDRLLPLEERLALWLRHGEQLGSNAIAAALGKSDAAVRQMISRAHAKLRDALGNDDRQPDELEGVAR
ncbi:MAG: sigma-70 family RNA polymerase sigma factor [Planctomycetota bacterium]